MNRNIPSLFVAALALLLLISCSSVETTGQSEYIGPGDDDELVHLGLLGLSPPLPTPPTPKSITENFPAEGPIKLSVEDAVLFALENNRSLKIEKLNPSIRETSEDVQRSAFDPSLNASVSGSRSRTKTDTSDSRSYSTGAELGISRTLPIGTSIGAGVSTDRNWSDSSSDSHATGFDISINHPLLQGSGKRVNLASLRQAKIDTDVSRYQLRGFAESLVSQVQTTYWDYVLASRQIEIYSNSLKLAEQQLSETQERVKVGKLAETELAAARAQVALRKEDLINARSSLDKLRLSLLRLLSPPGEEIWDKEIIARDEPAIPDAEFSDVRENIREAVKMRSDLNQARLSYKRGDLEVVKTKNGLLPRLDLFINLGKTGYAESFHGSLKEFNRGSYNYSAGITLEYPMGNRAAKAAHRRALLNRKQALESIKNLKQLIELDVRTSFIEVKRSREQVSATAATRKAQEETLRAEREKFRVGKSTSFLVAQALRDSVAAEVSEIQAIVNYLKALVALYETEGTLLERLGIEAPGADTVEEE